MKNIAKILAFISVFVISIMFTGAVSAANCSVNPGNSIQSVINNVSDNDTIIIKDNNGTAYKYKNNLDGNISQINTTRIVRANINYNCGSVALAKVINSMGINATQDELASLAKTDTNGTTMYGLQQAARTKGLNAITGMKLSINELKPNNIVFLTINGGKHYSIIKNITDNIVYLADPNLGNIEMTLGKFNEIYSGNALIITNDTNNIQLNSTKTLSISEMEILKGNLLVGLLGQLEVL